MKKILYFSRGRGYGHFVVDLIIKKKINEVYPYIEIVMASYADGLEAMRSNNVEAIPLDISLENEFDIQAIKSVIRAINEVKPDLILSHEMFYANSIAQKLSIPSILLTHWFFEQITPNDFFYLDLQQLMNCANEVIILDLPQFHLIPDSLNSPVSFVGPILREFNHSKSNQKLTRKYMNLSEDIELLCLSLGGRFKESEFIAESAINAFKQLNDSSLGLVFMAGPNFYKFKSALQNVPNVFIGSVEWDKYMDIQATSDIAITRGTFTTLCELAAIGIPSISILNNDNPVDMFHAINFETLGTTITVPSEELYIELLINLIYRIRANKSSMIESGEPYRNIKSLDQTLKIISRYII